MEVVQPQDTPNQNPANTRIKKCLNCEATVTENRIETARFGTRIIYAWVQDQWPSMRGFCPTCELVEAAKEQAIREELCRQGRERRKKQEMDALFKSFGGEKPATEFTFDKFDGILNFTALQKARAFDPSRHNLFLYGPTGTGKTHLACALAREQLEHGMDVEFYKVPALMREFRRRMEPDEEEALLKQLIKAPVLVIDDLGVGKATEYVIEKLHEVIDGRQNEYRHGLVLTSNLSLNGIAETFKDRIADRLNGMCEQVKMEGDSHRKRG